MAKKNKRGDHSRRVHKSIELEEMNIILKIPADAAAVTVEAIILDDDGKTQKVAKHLNVSDIHAARQDFLGNVEDGDEYDARFVITEEGQQYLEELERTQEGAGRW